MRDQALDPAKRFRQREVLERVHKSLDCIDPTIELEAHHRTKSILLGRGNRVPGMRAEAGIVNASHRAVRCEELGNPRGILAVDAHPCMQRTNTPKREKAVEGRASDAEAVRPPR